MSKEAFFTEKYRSQKDFFTVVNQNIVAYNKNQSQLQKMMLEALKMVEKSDYDLNQLIKIILHIKKDQKLSLNQKHDTKEIFRCCIDFLNNSKHQLDQKEILIKQKNFLNFLVLFGLENICVFVQSEIEELLQIILAFLSFDQAMFQKVSLNNRQAFYQFLKANINCFCFLINFIPDNHFLPQKEDYFRKNLKIFLLYSSSNEFLENMTNSTFLKLLISLIKSLDRILLFQNKDPTISERYKQFLESLIERLVKYLFLGNKFYHSQIFGQKANSILPQTNELSQSSQSETYFSGQDSEKHLETQQLYEKLEQKIRNQSCLLLQTIIRCYSSCLTQNWNKLLKQTNFQNEFLKFVLENYQEIALFNNPTGETLQVVNFQSFFKDLNLLSCLIFDSSVKIRTNILNGLILLIEKLPITKLLEDLNLTKIRQINKPISYQIFNSLKNLHFTLIFFLKYETNPKLLNLVLKLYQIMISKTPFFEIIDKNEGIVMLIKGFIMQVMEQSSEFQLNSLQMVNFLLNSEFKHEFFEELLASDQLFKIVGSIAEKNLKILETMNQNQDGVNLIQTMQESLNFFTKVQNHHQDQFLRKEITGQWKQLTKQVRETSFKQKCFLSYLYQTLEQLSKYNFNDKNLESQKDIFEDGFYSGFIREGLQNEVNHSLCLQCLSNLNSFVWEKHIFQMLPSVKERLKNLNLGNYTNALSNLSIINNFLFHQQFEDLRLHFLNKMLIQMKDTVEQNGVSKQVNSLTKILQILTAYFERNQQSDVFAVKTTHISSLLFKLIQVKNEKLSANAVRFLGFFPKIFKSLEPAGQQANTVQVCDFSLASLQDILSQDQKTSSLSKNKIFVNWLYCIRNWQSQRIFCQAFPNQEQFFESLVKAFSFIRHEQKLNHICLLTIFDLKPNTFAFYSFCFLQIVEIFNSNVTELYGAAQAFLQETVTDLQNPNSEKGLIEKIFKLFEQSFFDSNSLLLMFLLENIKVYHKEYQLMVQKDEKPNDDEQQIFNLQTKGGQVASEQFDETLVTSKIQKQITFSSLNSSPAIKNKLNELAHFCTKLLSIFDCQYIQISYQDYQTLREITSQADQDCMIFNLLQQQIPQKEK